MDPANLELLNREPPDRGALDSQAADAEPPDRKASDGGRTDSQRRDRNRSARLRPDRDAWSNLGPAA